MNWINCSTRMPTSTDEVLCIFVRGQVKKDGFFFYRGEFVSVQNVYLPVTDWMPFPDGDGVVDE